MGPQPRRPLAIRGRPSGSAQSAFLSLSWNYLRHLRCPLSLTDQLHEIFERRRRSPIAKHATVDERHLDARRRREGMPVEDREIRILPDLDRSHALVDA